MTKIKLCGITQSKDIEVINELCPEYIGFVFWDRSKRNISRESAKELKALLREDIKTVGVFVDEELEKVISLYRDEIIDIAQLHGNESEEYILALKKEGIETIKAFKVTDEEVVNIATASVADYIMFDAGKGEGMSFNWKLIERVSRPFFLAGGLDAGNVKNAIEATMPYAVDVSSGIESGQFKDAEKMRQFVKTVRGEL